MLRYANPANFLRFAAAVIPWTAGLAAILIGVGLYKTFFMSPADYQQGNTVRIMYIHVPAAWLAMFCYATMALSALGTLVLRHPLADGEQTAAAPMGAALPVASPVTASP